MATLAGVNEKNNSYLFKIMTTVTGGQFYGADTYVGKVDSYEMGRIREALFGTSDLAFTTVDDRFLYFRREALQSTHFWPAESHYQEQTAAHADVNSVVRKVEQKLRHG